MPERRSGIATAIAAIAGVVGVAAALWAVRRSPSRPEPQRALPPPRAAAEAAFPVVSPSQPEPEDPPAPEPVDAPSAAPPIVAGIAAATPADDGGRDVPVPERNNEDLPASNEPVVAPEPEDFQSVDSYNTDLVQTVIQLEMLDEELAGVETLATAESLVPSTDGDAAMLPDEPAVAGTPDMAPDRADELRAMLGLDGDDQELPARDPWSTNRITETARASEPDSWSTHLPLSHGVVQPASMDDSPAAGAPEPDPVIEELDRLAAALFDEHPPDLPPIILPSTAVGGAIPDTPAGFNAITEEMPSDKPDAERPAEPGVTLPEPGGAVSAGDVSAAAELLDEGNAFFNVGQTGLAIQRYTSAIERNPRLVAAYYNRGNAYARTGRLDEARADYDLAVSLLPGDADTLNNRGMVHLYRDDFRAALSDFERALELAPADVTIRINRGLALLRLDRPEQAGHDFQIAMEQAPGDAAAFYGGAQAAVARGDLTAALGHLRTAFTIDRAYVREAAGDPMLAGLDGYEPFHRLLREFGTRG